VGEIGMVSPDYLPERGLARAARAGAERVTLSVVATNTALLQACEALGFTTRFVFVGMTRSLQSD